MEDKKNIEIITDFVKDNIIFATFFIILTCLFVLLELFNVSKLAIVMNAYMEDFLLEQLENFRKYIKVPYIIVLNCSDELFEKLKNKNIDNVILNPIHFNKKRLHGSLLKGIISNIDFTIKNYNVDKILILSNRCFLKKEINRFNLKYKLLETKLQNLFWRAVENTRTTRHTPTHNVLGENGKWEAPECASVSIKKSNIDLNTWHWPKFKDTILFKKYHYLGKSAHEGLLLDIKSCKFLIKFMENNSSIKEDLFNSDSCVEEFAIQTILVNNNFIYCYLRLDYIEKI